MKHSDRPLGLLLRKLELHSTLEEDDRAAILALPHTMRTVDASTYIVREGDLPNQCSVLVSGFAYRQKVTDEGARQIVAIHMPGEPLDFQNLFLDVSDHSVQALTRAELVAVKRADLQKLVRARPAIAHAVMVLILVEASIFREWVLNVGRRNARARLAHLLCEFGIRLDALGLTEQYGYELPMTQEQLGDTLGLTSVHVNRTLKLLEDDGLIVRNKRNVGFPDWQRLRQEGDFNQRYLHLEPQKTGAPS